MEVTVLCLPSVLVLAPAAMPPEGIDRTSIITLLLGLVGLTIVVLCTRRRIRRSQQLPSAAHELPASPETYRNATRDLEEVMLQLDQLSRDIHGRIDTKLARLEALIRDADLRIAQLSQLASPSQKEHPPLPSRERAGVRVLEIGSKPAAEVHPVIEVTLDEENPFAQREDASNGEPDPHAAVYRLADSGLSPAQIANELGRLNGEIELILALRKAKDQAAHAGHVPGRRK